MADSVDPDQTAPMQSDQGLHYLPALSTLFADKDEMPKKLGNLYIDIRAIHYFYFSFCLLFYAFNMGKQVFLPDM